MNKNEQRVLNVLRRFRNLADIRASQDPMCRYDLFSDTHIIECKFRKSLYDGTTLIERPKFEANLADGRKFVYAVSVGNSLYLFDITKMADSDGVFNWQHQRQVQTTYFDNNNKVVKEIAYIPFDSARYVIDLQTNRLYDPMGERNED